MEKRTFVIGDIHGGYKALEQVLERAGLKPSDRLIFLGDYVDGWSESPKVVAKLMELNNTHDCMFIRGNHDALFTEWLDTGKTNALWLNHGGRETIQSYKNTSKKERRDHLQFLQQLQNYHIDIENRLFVHAGFTNMHGPQHDYYTYVYYWDRTLWETALATDEQLTPKNNRFPKRFTHFNEIYIGHTPTTRHGSSSPFHALNLWNVDTGAAFKGRLSMLNIDTKQVVQSDPVHLLYPGERGRN